MSSYPSQQFRYMIFNIFTWILSHLRVYNEGNQLPVGLISQLVEHCTGITEVMGSNPVQAWILLRISFHNCLSCVYNCDDRWRFHISVSWQFKDMIFHILNCASGMWLPNSYWANTSLIIDAIRCSSANIYNLLYILLLSFFYSNEKKYNDRSLWLSWAHSHKRFVQNLNWRNKTSVHWIRKKIKIWTKSKLRVQPSKHSSV